MAFKLIADTHTHTLACGHAYSTISENAAVAAERGLRILCMTEHAPALEGAPGEMFFSGLSSVPSILHGVMILKGVEVNIMDHTGKVDLPNSLLESLDWIIASMHVPVFPPSTVEIHTNAWLKVAENPSIDVIGHCGDGRYPFDEDRVLRAFKENHKIVEINNHSFENRKGSKENCRRIALKCKELSIPVVVSSDAHFSSDVGNFTLAIEMLQSIDFPEELILNADYNRFMTLISMKDS